MASNPGLGDQSGSNGSSSDSSGKGNWSSHESGTSRFRHWLEQQLTWTVESPRLKQNPTSALVFDELRDDLDEYDKLETKKRELLAGQMKTNEAFENSYKTLIASCVATTIAGLVYGYNRNRAGEQEVLPSLISFVGTLAPILLSLFILIRARFSHNAAAKDLAQLQDQLNVQAHLICITSNEFADMLNELRTIDRSHTYEEKRDAWSQQKEDKVQQELTERMHRWHGLVIKRLIRSLMAHQRKRQEADRRQGRCTRFWLWFGRWFCCCCVKSSIDKSRGRIALVEAAIRFKKAYPFAEIAIDKHRSFHTAMGLTKEDLDALITDRKNKRNLMRRRFRTWHAFATRVKKARIARQVTAANAAAADAAVRAAEAMAAAAAAAAANTVTAGTGPVAAGVPFPGHYVSRFTQPAATATRFAPRARALSDQQESKYPSRPDLAATFDRVRAAAAADWRHHEVADPMVDPTTQLQQQAGQSSSVKDSVSIDMPMAMGPT